MPSDFKILRFILKSNLGFINLLLPEILHSLSLVKHIRIFRFIALCSFQSGEVNRRNWVAFLLKIVNGIVEHSYYLWRSVNTDIRFSIDGFSQDASQRKRKLKGQLQNVWEIQ